jgi:hypothetical protein
MAVIISSILCLMINVFIFINVHSSSRRIQPQSPYDVQYCTLSRRDIHLLRHIIFMFCIFVGGWTPNCLSAIIAYHAYINMLAYFSFSILCELALLCDIIDLFLYNHEFRNYLKLLFFNIFNGSGR